MSMTQIQLFTCMVAEINSLFHEAAYRCGIPDSVLTTLYVLYGNAGSAEISTVRKLTGLRKQTLNAALRKMELFGAIRLEQSEGKHKTIVLTPRGLALAEATAGTMCALSERAVGDYSEDDLALIMGFAGDFLTNFKSLIGELPKVNKRDLLALSSSPPAAQAETSPAAAQAETSTR